MSAMPKFPSGFDPQPELAGENLLLRPLVAEDLEGLYAAASDPRTWEGHPAKERYKREVFEPYFGFLLASGSTLAVVDRAAAAIIGCSSYYMAPDRDALCIGFTFLNNAYWGGRTNREMKGLMLAHAFAHVPEVWFHIAPDNIRSQTATARLGASYVYSAVLDLTGTPAENMCFRLTRDDWQRATSRSTAEPGRPAAQPT